MNRRLLWTATAAVCVAAGSAAYGFNGLLQSTCMATNASGQRVVIGTELTAKGKDYRQLNPAEDNNAVLEAVGRYGPELIWTPESIWRCRLMLTVSEVVWGPLLGLGVIFGVVASRTSARTVVARRGGKPRVFISYNHSDADHAQRVQRLLEKQGIEVIIDAKNMTPGERITDFIRRSLSDSDAVVSIVSDRSLLSAWVAMETIQALQRNNWTKDKQFIACYLDDGFLRDDYRLEATRRIDERLERIEELLRQYTSERLDPVDLNEEKTRLYNLRNNLGLILATLKNSLCLDLRNEHFEENGRGLIAAVRSPRLQ